MREFTVGGVLRRVGGLFAAHPGLILGLTLLFVALPHAAVLAALRFAPPSYSGFGGVAFVVYWLGSLLLQAAVVRMGMDGGSRRPSRFADLLGAAAKCFFPILGITILVGLAVSLASILLVFPGLMLFCRWFVAVPAEVAERNGVMASLGRSAALTDGVRWRVFGVLLVFTVLNFVVSFGFGFLGGLANRLVPGGWLLLVGTVIGIAASMLIGSLFYAAAYFELREGREGAMSEEMISVFS